MFTKFLGFQNAYLVGAEGATNEFIALVRESNPLFRTSSASFSSFDISQVQDAVTLQQVSHFTCVVAKLDATEKPFHRLVQPLKREVLQ